MENDHDTGVDVGLRRRLLEALSALLKRPGANLTPDAVAAEAGVDPDEIGRAFRSFGDLMDSWFGSRARQAALLAAELPESESAGYEERLGAFCFVLLDVLDEYPGLPGNALRRHTCGLRDHTRGALRDGLALVVDAPDVPGLNRPVVGSTFARMVLAEVVLHLVATAIEDRSEDRARSAALIDRTVALIGAAATSPVPQRFVELLRYLWESGYRSAE